MEQKLYICYNKNTLIMNLETRKYNFIESLVNVDEATLDKLEIVLKQVKTTPKRISLEQYNKEIDEAIAEAERGEFYTQEEVEKMAEKW